MTLAEMKAGIRKATIAVDFIPVMCGSALKNKGVQQLLDAVVEYLPSPLDVPPVRGLDPDDLEKHIERAPSDAEPFCALAFKIAADPFVGKLAFFRVYSGTIKAGSYVLNTSTGNKERIGRIVRLHANTREDVTDVYAGEIAAAVGLKETFTGHTLSDPDHPILLEAIVFPEPVISIAIEPKTKADQEKMGIALQKLAEEDPNSEFVQTRKQSSYYFRHGELHSTLSSIVCAGEFNVDANVGKPQVSYRETVKGNAEGEGKYIRQTGGRGQYGHALVRVEKLPAGTGVEFVEEVKGGAIPREYFNPIEKGIREAADRGVLAGYPLLDVRVTLYDGSYHEVDSSEAAFKIAGSMAFQDAKAGLDLLEPMMKVEAVAEIYRTVVGDLNAARTDSR